MKLKKLSLALAGVFGMAHQGLQTYMQRTGLMLNAIAQTVDKLDAVPEAQRGWYVEKDGKFNLDVSKIEIEDTGGLKSALQKERDEKKTTAAALKLMQDQFKDIDPAKVRELMSKLDGDEEGKLIAAGKLDEVVARRSEKMRAELQKQVEAAAAREKAANDRAGKFSQRVLDNHIRAAATKAGIHSHAIEDALFRARTMFSLNEDGDPVQLGSDGAIVMGKDGKTAFSPAEWLESMKEAAPHWYPANGTGSGAQGNGKDGNAKTMTRAHYDSLDAVAQRTAAKDYKIVD